MDRSWEYQNLSQIMNTEIRSEAVQFRFGEYVNRIFFAVLHQVPIYLKKLVRDGGRVS